MQLRILIRKYFWHIIIRIIFYSTCAGILFHLYHLHPPPLRPLKILASPPPPRSNIEENYYQVIINGENTNDSTLFLSEKNGNLWVAANDLSKWKFVPPAKPPVSYDSEKYYNLKQLTGLTYTIDPINMIIKMNAPAQLFGASQFNANGSKIINFTPPSPGMFFNYNLLETKNINTTPHSLFNGLFTIGVFSRYGVGTNTFIVQNAPNTSSPIRLTTTWRYDQPEKMWTLSLGDDISTPTSWSDAVNFGGVQWGTNFTTQPTFITFPQPGVKGQATVPSAVNLYANNNLVQRQQVSPGPFAITNIPYVTGSGDLRMVTTDIQGRQQVITVPFYVSNQLLKAGLTNSTYEIGILRQNLGISNFDYARTLIAATKSVGITDDLTAQWHIEALSDQQSAGLSAFKNIFNFAVVNGSIAASHMNGGKDGALLLLAFQRLTPTYSVNASSQITTEYFTQQGLTPGQLSPRLINQIGGGFTLHGNSFGISCLHEINRGQPSSNMVTASYSRDIFFEIALSLTVTNQLSGTKNQGVFLSLSRTLDNQTSVSMVNNQQNGIHQSSAQLLRALPPGPGYGYSLTAGTGTQTSSNIKQGSFSYQNDIGTYVAQINEMPGQINYSLNAVGSIVLLDGTPYLTRNLYNNSFGVAKVPGMPNVDVYVNNQVVSHTNKKGNALIPNLLPYQETQVAIDTNQIPLNTNIDASSRTVAPYYRSGIIINFPVKVIRSGTITVKQASGVNVPEGASVTIVGQKDDFIVGGEGEVYLTGLDNENIVDINWEEHHCQFTLKVPPVNPQDLIPELGVFICKEVTNEENKNTTTPIIPNKSIKSVQ